MGRRQHRVLLNREMLYVGELSLMTTERDLFKVFDSVAQVAGVYLPRDGSNFSRGFAFIKFQTANDAARAMHMLSNRLLNGKPILVKYAFENPAMPLFEVGRIFIKNLDKSVTLEALRDVFSAFGKILSCAILRDLGYATVCFDNMEASLRALEQMNKFFKGTNIYIDPFMREEDNALALGEKQKVKWSYLYIDNVDEKIGDDRLLRLFSRFGVITSYKVRTDYGRLGRVPRLVAFSTPMEGSVACSAMHGQLVGNKRLYVVPDRTRPQFSDPRPAGVVPFVRADPGQAPRECHQLQPEWVHLVHPDPEEEEDSYVTIILQGLVRLLQQPHHFLLTYL